MPVIRQSLLHRCLSAVIYGVGGAVGSRVLMLLANVLLSRMLGQEIFGQFSSINSTVNLFVTFSGLGISATLTRFIAAYKNQRDRIGNYIKTLSSICFVMSLSLSAILFFFADEIAVLSTGSTQLTNYYKIVAISVFFAGMSAVEHSIMIGFELFRQASVVQLIRCALYCVLGYIMSMLWGIYGAVYAVLLSHGIQYFLSLVINRHYYASQGIKPYWKWNSELKTITLTYAVPAFLSGLFVMPVHWVGNAMLTRTTGFTEMAIFTVANQWMTYITYIPSQLGQMRPIYTDLYMRNQLKSLRNLLIRITVTTTLAAVGIGICVSVCSKFILSVYGEGYLSGQITFILMVMAAILYTAQVQTGFMLQAMNKMWCSVAINALWGICLIAFYGIMISLGSIGYALSYCIAYLISFVIQLLIMVHNLRHAQDYSE